MRPAALVALAVVLASSGPAAAKTLEDWPAGFYGDVRLSPKSGDLGGLELRFYEEAGRRMVEFVMCEGGCNKAYKLPLTRTQDGFAFSYREKLVTYPDKAVSYDDWRFLIRPDGKALKIFGWLGQQSVNEGGKPERLKRIAKPFGLAVAAEEEKRSDARED